MGEDEKSRITQVSIHSRPKAAADRRHTPAILTGVSIHSRPKAAGFGSCMSHSPLMFQYTAARRRLSPIRHRLSRLKCFNTQPPEGGCPFRGGVSNRADVSIHSRPKAAASFGGRYWLPTTVSIHSRPKAAAVCMRKVNSSAIRFQYTAARRRLLPPEPPPPFPPGFNTQPPEGG